ncbi:hypothetical protein C0995_010446 [Termitomyces sp. Mi166|nr:hypothetical protein C0995_010446 [Termitomyces sp. Mi166\
MLDYRSLPLEICLLILETAIASEKAADFITPSYIPFQPVPDDSLDPVTTVRAKVALVRRLILPYRMTVTSDADPSRLSLEILRLCTNLEVLVRPRSTSASEVLLFHFETNGLRLLSLRRLDWWYHSEAERSGGINSLSDVLQGTPNLEYLSVGGIAGYYPILKGPYPLTLRNLRTLRLHHGSNGFLLRVIANLWSLPALINIIVDSPVAHTGLSHVWETLGAQLQTVEFGKHVRFMLDDHITACLQGCPNLVELNYHLFFTMAPVRNIRHHSSISRIGLHAAVNQLLNDGHKVCEHIEEHLAVFLDDTLPSLRRLVLHGEWRGIISHPRLAKLWQALDKRGIIATLSNCG